MSEPEYDLIIVGGGPAGAGAALFAHRQGLRALLLDRATFPRDKACGDSISGKSLAVLDELGLMEAVAGLPGAIVQRVLLSSPNQTVAVFDMGTRPYRDPLTGRQAPAGGLVVRRRDFDALLFERARQVSAGCLEGFTVRDLLMDGGRVVGVRGYTGRRGAGEGVAEFRAPLVLGCDGANSAVARRAGALNHDPGHWSVAVRCYFRGMAAGQGQNEVYFADEIMPGYLWIFPLEDGIANVGVGMLHSALRRRRVSLGDLMTQVISQPPFAERFAAAEPLERPAAWPLPLGSRRQPCSGAGYMLLGDAASLIDPFSGEGIGNALYSARVAIEVAAEAHRHRDFTAAFLNQYSDRLWRALGPELKVSTFLQRAGRWPSFVNLILGRAARHDEVARLLTNAYTNTVPRQQLLDPLLYLKMLWK